MENWIHVEHKYLLLAMKEYDKFGMVGARVKFGFKPANRVHMYYPGKDKPYEARVLVAIAHSLQSPNKPKLTPKSFTGYGNLASKWLAKNGFEERQIVRTPKQQPAGRLRVVK